jgi:alpha-beta hydrolase superfamily lysophospholipase
VGTEETITLDGVRGSVVSRLRPHADPRYLAVVVHGYGEHGARYAHVVDALAAHGASVVVPDHHGHGRSDGERVFVEDPDEYVADLHAVVTRARAGHPGLPVVVIGHSMGGLIATRYAQLHPDDVDVLVLSAPVIGYNPGFQALASMDPIPPVPIEPAALSRDPSVGEAYAADPLVWHGPFKKLTLVALLDAADTIAAGPGFGALPTFWINGENDALAPVDIVRPAVERLRGATFEERVYPGAMHEVFNETNRDEVIADVLGFVDRHLPPSASP